MLEIRKNVIGDIVVKETEDRKGLGTIWNFKGLQDYISKNDVNKDSLHHLCMYAVEEMSYISMIELKEAEKLRLCSDLERMIRNYYYSEEERDFTVELKEGQLEFKENDFLIQKVTLQRFIDDFEFEPDIKENALQFINFALSERRLNRKEQEKLSTSLIEIYKSIKEEQQKKE